MSKIVELERQSDSLQTDLLISLKNCEFEKFERILLSHGMKEFCTPNCPCIYAIDLNHLYDEAENKTLLDIACSSVNKAAFVQFLLRHRVWVNSINCTHGAAPIHLAVSNSDFDTVKLLVENEKIKIHIPNTADRTAFHLAAQRKRKDFIKLLQERQEVDIERAKIKVRQCELKLERNKYITHEETNSLQTPKRSESSENDESLSFLLRNRNYEAFKCKASVENVQLIDNALGFTYLQYACKYGLIEFVEFLLGLNVDPNQTGGNQETPIVLAAYQGYHDIIKLLQNTGIISYEPYNGNTILHSTIRGYLKLGNFKENGRMINLDDGGKRDHVKCLKLILNKVPEYQLEVDKLDSLGNSPLYYAILSDNRDMILSLIERGAYVGVKTKCGRSVIQYMNPATLEYFLDESMGTINPSTDEHFHSENMWPATPYKHFDDATFNYNWLMYDEMRLNRKPVNERNLLKALSEVSELRPVLKHPLFLILLDIKWHIIVKKIFFIDLGIYIQFVFFLSIYLLTPTKDPKILARPFADFVWCSVLIGNSIMLLKEFAQSIIYWKVNKYKYISDPKNYMEITLIIIVYVILFGEIQPIQMKNTLAAIAILLSYMGLIQLVLNHPTMSIQIEMFKVVASNALKVLMSYVILILAFAFTFFLLFKDVDSMDESFKKFFKTIFKTLIMLTGEYEVTNILSNDNYGISHLVFILFIFLIPVVLCNLLNAIAVSDIRAIKKKAELVSAVARVKLITHMEEVIFALFSLYPLSAYYLIDNAKQMWLFNLKNFDRERKEYDDLYKSVNESSSPSREIFYRAHLRQCYVIEDNRLVDLNIVVSPFTDKSIREKLSTETSKEEKVEAHC